VLLVQHLNRCADAVDPLARIADSQGIPQLARSVLLWGPEPSDPQGDRGTMKVLTRAKGNLARATYSATLTIAETTIASGIKAPVLERGEHSSIDASDISWHGQRRSSPATRRPPDDRPPLPGPAAVASFARICVLARAAPDVAALKSRGRQPECRRGRALRACEWRRRAVPTST
jgi:hypothetical protein